LLLSSGVSFAYYSADTISNGDTTSVTDVTNDVKSGSVSAEEKVSMNNKNLYPGHKEIVSVKVTGTGDKIVLFNLIYEGINTFNTELNYNVYKTTEEVDIKYICEKKVRVENGAQILREECNATNISELGSVITSGTLNKSETTSKQVLLSEQAIETSERGTVEYYYVEIIYPNLNSNQNSDLNSKIQGKITVESSQKEYIRPSLVYTASTVSGENEWYKSVDITGSIEGTSDEYTGTYCIGNTICIPTENLNITNKSFNIEMPSNANSQVLCTNITDKYGISVSSCTESYKVDGEVPRGNISIENERNGSNSWYKALTLKVTGEDNNSRVSSIKHCTTTSTTCIPSTTVNGSSASVTLPNNASEQKVCYQIKDNAGNESVVACSSSYKVDGEIPTITIGTTSSTANSVTLNVSGSDKHSKMDKYYY